MISLEKTIIVFDDGAEISSGVGSSAAVRQAVITRAVNDGTDLSIGSACAAMVELSILIKLDTAAISAGQHFAVWREADDSKRQKIGEYWAEKPTMETAARYKVTAYDAMIKLDADLTSWLASLNGWPYRLDTFCGMVCTQCGVDWGGGDFPNAAYEIPQFLANGITGRKLMQWAGQAAARYVYADADGKIRFGWYTDSGVQITPGGDRYYFQNGLKYEDYQVAQIDQVRLALTEDDIGTGYPATGSNPYVITGNYLLTASGADQLSAVAQAIYAELSEITYTPGSIAIPVCQDIQPGSIVSITDKNGKSLRMLVMEKVTSGMKDTLSCTGNASRDASSAIYDESFGAVNSKIFEIRRSIDGLVQRAASTETSLSGLDVKISEMSTSFEQTASEISIKVERIISDGVDKVRTSMGYTFDDEGLQINKAGEQIHNRLNHEGMLVARGDEAMLQADKDGVLATDVRVRNYLIIGKHCRVEDYSKSSDSQRTAVFWIPEE